MIKLNKILNLSIVIFCFSGMICGMQVPKKSTSNTVGDASSFSYDDLEKMNKELKKINKEVKESDQQILFITTNFVENKINFEKNKLILQNSQKENSQLKKQIKEINEYKIDYEKLIDFMKKEKMKGNESSLKKYLRKAAIIVLAGVAGGYWVYGWLDKEYLRWCFTDYSGMNSIEKLIMKCFCTPAVPPS
jgi:hypothetical protein